MQQSFATLAERYQQVRAHSLALTASLSAEDQCVQSMADASPTKWHLGHTSWFFETVVLKPAMPGYAEFDSRWPYLFNSYYEALGPRHPRPQRGHLTRPTLAQVHEYRNHVDRAILGLLPQLQNANLTGATEAADSANSVNMLALIELGLQHEQQHQELLLTDILHLFSCSPLLPAVAPLSSAVSSLASSAGVGTAPQWLQINAGLIQVGHLDSPHSGFAFDIEGPAHQRLVAPFLIANRLVTCGEYLAFIQDGGYNQSAWWLSDGWGAVQTHGWTAPAYWIAPGDPRCLSDEWQVFGLHGVLPLDLAQPVAQLSFYEAAAFAEWAGARLPTEFEWEAATTEPAITQLHGALWQWTRSAYEPYPEFKPRNGAVREYNGKFMVGQQVLRGSSVATPSGHSRNTYRNFFPPAARWQFTGLRLAKDI